MTHPVSYLQRIGDNVKKYKIFKLEGNQVTIGRACEVTYSILSNMISRYHAVVKKLEDNTWTITDNKSLNGIYVNGQLLTPCVPHKLCEGDLVQLGVPLKPNTPAEFIYKYCSGLESNKTSKRKRPETLSEKSNEQSQSSDEEERERQRKHPASNRNGHECLMQEVEEVADYKAEIEEMKRLLKEKEENEKLVQQELERERKEKEEVKQQVKAAEMRKEREQALIRELMDSLKKKEEQLDEEKENLKRKLQEDFEASLKEREAALLLQLAAQQEALRLEKCQVEENLSKEKAKVLEEKNKDLEKQLLNQKEKLEKIIEKKELEQKMLESQLNSTKEETESAKLQALKAKEEILSSVVELMEVELQCSICSELFIKATSLNCSHIFCKLCINQWLRVKKECAICRKAVKSQFSALMLDSYIDRMVEQLSEEHKSRRKAVIEQRKIDQDAFDGITPGPSNPAPIVVPLRGRGHPVTRRGGRRGNRVQAEASERVMTRAQQASAVRISSRRAQATAAPADPIMVIDSDSSEENESDDPNNYLDDVDLENLFNQDSSFDEDWLHEELYNSDSSVEGVGNAYYGGYGHCYKCGARGHWARGCPLG